MADILDLITALLSEDAATLDAVQDPAQARAFLAWLAREPETPPAALAPALWRLAGVARGLACGCGLYPGSGGYAPASQQAAGRVDILAHDARADSYCTTWRCRCTACGALFAVSSDIGPQRASYDWQRMSPDHQG